MLNIFSYFDLYREGVLKMLSYTLTKKGFTLIELLIVVAIIAILAAIAVPNFLAAQTKAKVSRVYADMNASATAIESYCVDNNQYPCYGGRDSLITPAAPVADAGPHFMPYNLTTPVAYLSSLFNEVFPGRNTPEGIPQIHELHYFNRYQSPNWWANKQVVWLRDYGTDAANMQWYLSSNGPDLWCNAAGQAIYDPTNGTVSSGDLVWFGPGKGKM